MTDANGRPLLDFANAFRSDNLQDQNYSSNSPVGQIFGFPVIIDNGIPALTASTTGGPCFANLDKAMILRTTSGTTSCMRLTERYADYLAVGYLGWSRFDM